MRRRTPLAALAACWLATGVVLAQTPRADTVFANGHFYLPGGSWASFMAVGRGVILGVGDEAAVADYKGPKTQTIDLHGAHGAARLPRHAHSSDQRRAPVSGMPDPARIHPGADQGRSARVRREAQVR